MNLTIIAVLSLIFLTAQAIGALKQIGSPLIFVGRIILMFILKSKKMYPIQIRQRKDVLPSAFIRYGVGISVAKVASVNELYVSVPVELKVWDKKSTQKIQDVKIRLIQDNDEYVGIEECDENGRFHLQNKVVSDITDDYYQLIFSLSTTTYPYLKEWYNSSCLPEMQSSISFKVLESLCTHDTGVVRKRK
jgi:hypothetical protein